MSFLSIIVTMEKHLQFLFLLYYPIIALLSRGAIVITGPLMHYLEYVVLNIVFKMMGIYYIGDGLMVDIVNHSVTCVRACDRKGGGGGGNWGI